MNSIGAPIQLVATIKSQGTTPSVSRVGSLSKIQATVLEEVDDDANYASSDGEKSGKQEDENDRGRDLTAGSPHGDRAADFSSIQ